jgi:hypothetical protein
MRAQLAACVAALVLAGVPGLALAERAVPYVVSPPLPLVESVPPERPGYSWADGYWSWDGTHFVWVQGSYIKERPGFVYTAPRWVAAGGRSYFESARWEQPGSTTNIASAREIRVAPLETPSN